MLHLLKLHTLGYQIALIHSFAYARLRRYCNLKKDKNFNKISILEQKLEQKYFLIFFKPRGGGVKIFDFIFGPIFALV